MDAARGLAHRAFDFRVAGVADHHDVAALLAHPRDLDVHLGDQRACRVEHAEAACFGIGAHRLGDAVRGEHDRRAGRNLVQLLDEHRALVAQVVDDELVVDHFVAHVDRRAELHERLLDDRDRAVDAGAEAARIGENDVHHLESLGAAGAASPGRSRKLSMMRKAAPTVIALSATLNAGHDHPA